MLDNKLIEKIERQLDGCRGIKFIATDKQETEMCYNADKKFLLVKLAKQDCKVDSCLKFKHRLEFIDMADPRIDLTELRRFSASRLGLLNIQGHKLNKEVTFATFIDKLDISNCEFLGKDWGSPFNYVKEINFKKFKAPNLKSTRFLFDGYNGTELDVTWLKNNQIEDASAMFINCMELREIKGLNKLNLSACKDISRIFIECTRIEKIDLSGLDLSNVENAQGLINGCHNLKEINLGNLDLNKGLTINKFGRFNSITQCNYNLKKITGAVPVEINENNITQMLDWCAERDELELDIPKIKSIKLTKRIVGYLKDYFGFAAELHIIEDTNNIMLKAEMFNDYIEDFGFFKSFEMAEDICYLAFEKVEVIDEKVRKYYDKQ